MSYSISGTTIDLTRGDTFEAHIDIAKPDGGTYTPDMSDIITFAAKRYYSDSSPCISKQINPANMLLSLTEEDTKDLPFGRYIYEIELRKKDGTVDTFITKGTLNLTEEVN